MNHSLVFIPVAVAVWQSWSATRSADERQGFWQTHLWWPLLAFTLIFGALEVFSLDRVLAQAWYFDAGTGKWLGSGRGEWWARNLLHDGGRWVVRGIAVGALTFWVLSYWLPSLESWRRSARFVTLAILLSVALVGALKAVTNVDCPWDLAGFGGHNPYVALFADRPDTLARARCFPGAHASSGFALVCFYFVFRDRSRRLAYWALAAALAVGVAFSIGQEARGAHFLSHDLASAGIVWFVQLGLYVVYARAPISGGRWMPQSTNANSSMCSGRRKR